jgi:hypothetical protein
VTEQEAITAITIAVPANMQANADTIAKVLLKKAILKVGRTPGQSWNSDAVTVSLTSGQSTYRVGVDVLGTYADFVNMQFLWRTDTQGGDIPILAVEEFNNYARGSTSSGAPQIATLHSSDETLEIWPIPDAAYSLWGYAQKKIVNFDEIPENLHDVLIDVAIDSFNPITSGVRAREGIKDVKSQSLTRWDGNTIAISRHLGGGGRTKPDSHNLRGD